MIQEEKIETSINRQAKPRFFGIMVHAVFAIVLMTAQNLLKTKKNQTIPRNNLKF